MTSTTQAAVPMPAPPSGLMLSVLEGMHRGVDARIDGQSCTVGSASHCDVVLADGQIAPDHLRLRFYGRQVAIDAVGGDVGIEGRAVVLRGHGCRVALPATLSIGAARLQVRRSYDEGGMMQRWLPIAGIGLMGVVVATLIATQSSGLASPIETARPAPAPRVVAAVPVGAAISDTLRARLAEGGLGGLSVAESDRHIEVSGIVPADSTKAWQETQQWFDSTYGGKYVLTSRVTTAAAATQPKLSFQAVWFGENPYVIDLKGERRYPGAALQDGWMLKSIGRDGIVVTRQGTDFQLTL